MMSPSSVIRGTLLALFVGLGPTLAGAQMRMPNEIEISGAIAEGTKTKRGLFHEDGRTGVAAALCAGAPKGSCGYQIVVQGPLGRVQSAAADAAKKYLKFSRDSLPPEVLAPELMVVVTPNRPSTASGVLIAPPDVVHVVLIGYDRKTKQESAPIQPTTVSLTEVTWGNLMGATRKGVGAVARFPLESVPSGEFIVVVVTAGEEGRFFVQHKHRPFIR